MLRAVVLTFGVVLALVGAGLCLAGVPWPGVHSLAVGAVVVVGVLFERWRYRNKAATADGHWQPTGERFVDPETGRDTEVLYDPRTGERRYVPITGRHDQPD